MHLGIQQNLLLTNYLKRLLLLRNTITSYYDAQTA